MTHEIGALIHWVHVCLIVAAFFATLFPLLYLISPWYKSVTGRLIMLQAISFAIVIDLTAVFQYWHPNNILFLFWVDTICFTLIAISSALLTFMLCYLNFYKYRNRGKHNDRTREKVSSQR